MTTYNIQKSYEGFPSKTNKNYQTNLSHDEAQAYLAYTANQWARNGGLVKELNETMLIVEEGDDSNTISFEIIEQ